MARVYQTYKTRIDSTTGQRAYVRDARGRKVPHTRFRFEYLDYRGKRVAATGHPDRKATERLALRLESEAAEIRNGYREPPKESQKQATRSFKDVTTEYLSWGESQGGRGGRPWGKDHAAKRRAHLTWWRKSLRLKTLADLPGILPRVEEALRDLQDEGKAGKTISNYAESLRAFCEWAKGREYIEENPLDGLAPFDTTPKSKRRAMTPEEIHALMEAAPEYRRLLYETAFTTGLRANELRHLEPEHLDVIRCGLQLDGAWTKNRKDGFVHIPHSLLEHLQAYAITGDARQRYEKNAKQRNNGKPLERPENPLLYVPRRIVNMMDTDLKAAGIPKITPGGKIDFHACRTAFVNLVLSSGADAKTAQVAARHASTEMTMNTYGRARETAMRELSETIGKAVFDGGKTRENYETGTKPQNGLSVNALKPVSYASRTRGSNPRLSANTTMTGSGPHGSSPGLFLAYPVSSHEVTEAEPEILTAARSEFETPPSPQNGVESIKFTEPVRNGNGGEKDSSISGPEVSVVLPPEGQLAVHASVEKWESLPGEVRRAILVLLGVGG